jgi:hypothetical protein
MTGVTGKACEVTAERMLTGTDWTRKLACFLKRKGTVKVALKPPVNDAYDNHESAGSPA